MDKIPDSTSWILFWFKLHQYLCEKKASNFVRIVLSPEIIMKSGASLNGRILAQTDGSLDDYNTMESQLFTSVHWTIIYV